MKWIESVLIFLYHLVIFPFMLVKEPSRLLKSLRTFLAVFFIISSFSCRGPTDTWLFSTACSVVVAFCKAVSYFVPREYAIVYIYHAKDGVFMAVIMFIKVWLAAVANILPFTFLAPLKMCTTRYDIALGTYEWFRSPPLTGMATY